MYGLVLVFCGLLTAHSGCIALCRASGFVTSDLSPNKPITEQENALGTT